MAHAAEIWHQDDATGPRQASGAQRLSRASRVHVVKHRSVTRAICLPSLTRTSQQIPIIPRWPMQLRSGIRMIPQGLDRSQGLRGSAEQAESMWCSTDQSPEHFDYFDLHQDITADTIKAQVAYAAEIWHLDDASERRQVSGAQRTVEQAESMWSSTDQSQEHFAFSQGHHSRFHQGPGCPGPGVPCS
jgi:hypothetical protein